MAIDSLKDPVQSGHGRPAFAGRPFTLRAPVPGEPQQDRAVALLQAIRNDIRVRGVTLRIAEAKELVDADIDAPTKAGLANILAHHFFESREFEQALHYCKLWQINDVGSISACKALISILVRLR